MKLVTDNGWRPIEDAPKDGQWIIGYRGGEIEPVYVVMRWWDGISPDDLDDLSGDEEGEWIGPQDRTVHDVTHWLSFAPHPSAPPITTSFEDDDALNGIKHLSRAERGITQDEIEATRAWHHEAEAEYDASSRVYTLNIDFAPNDNQNEPQPTGGSAA